MMFDSCSSNRTRLQKPLCTHPCGVMWRGRSALCRCILLLCLMIRAVVRDRSIPKRFVQHKGRTAGSSAVPWMQAYRSFDTQDATTTKLLHGCHGDHHAAAVLGERTLPRLPSLQEQAVCPPPPTVAPAWRDSQRLQYPLIKE